MTQFPYLYIMGVKGEKTVVFQINITEFMMKPASVPGFTTVKLASVAEVDKKTLNYHT